MKQIQIGSRVCKISGTPRDAYFRHLEQDYDRDMVSLCMAMCEPEFQILDIGANIGMTSILFSQLVPEGRVVAVEPISVTYDLLVKNLAVNQCDNARAFNFAASATNHTLRMAMPEHFLAGAFVAPDEKRFAAEPGNFSIIEVPALTLDSEMHRFGLTSVDLMKIDTEGHELDVLAGAAGILQEHRPTVILEMNHYCLNAFRRMSIPEFRDRLGAIFPSIFVIDSDGSYLDFNHPPSARHIEHEHITKFRYANLVAGFDESKLERRLAAHKVHQAKITPLPKPRSWNLTAPLRWLTRLIKRDRNAERCA